MSIGSTKLHGLGRGAFCRALSELRLHRGRTREVVTESLDAGRLGRVDNIDNVIARRDAIIRRGAIGYRGQQAAKVNIFQRIKGREQAVAGEIVVLDGFLQDGVGDLRLRVAELEESIRLLIWRVLG